MSLLDLPTEILGLITTQLDSTRLYSISQIHPRLADIALPLFFQGVNLHGEDGILRDGVLTLTPKQPPVDAAISRHTILGAISYAQFDIHTFKIEVWPDMQNAFMDLQDVLEILKRTKECTALELSFMALDDMEIPKTFDINGEAWAEVILGLVEEALKKGCKHLRILDGWFFIMAMTKHFLAFNAGVTASFLEALKPISPFGAFPPIIEETLYPWPPRLSNMSQIKFDLESCTLQQELFLKPPFLAWTISALNNSPHLTSLHFTLQNHMASFPPRVLLSTLTCPSLTELKLQDATIWSYKDLSGFLQRHSGTLRTLDISPRTDSTLVDWSTSLLPQAIPPMTEFITPMPMLEKISIAPVYLVWLMNQPLGLSSSLGFIFHVLSSRSSLTDELPLCSRFPRLKDVTLYVDDANGTIGYDFSYLERAFQVLALYIQSSKEGQSPLKTLAISSLVRKTALKPFFKKHQPIPNVPHQPSSGGMLGRIFGGSNPQPNPTSTSITSHLAGIHTFRVMIRNHPDSSLWEELSTFVKGFPGLETYEIVLGQTILYQSTSTTVDQATTL